ncbi:MAG: extracellular solute-binding protein [Clostridiales bacterium]|nr:extracellular solute-binding protein [Clostridiales bacterium]
MKRGFLKKTMAAVLAAATAFSVAACGDKSAQKEDENGTVELKVFSYMLSSEKFKEGDSQILKYIKDKLNIEITPMAANANNWNEKLNLVMTSGDMPDIFVSFGTGINNKQYKKWIKMGLMSELDPDSTEYPNIAKVLKEFDYVKNFQGGKHYFLPIKGYQGDYKASDDSAYYVRKDWLDNLGMKVPETRDEFINMMYAFGQKDPDGNGAADTYGITSGSKAYGLPYNMFDTGYTGYEKKGDKYVSKMIGDNMKNAIKEFRKMYKGGAIDPEFLIASDLEEKFVGGKIGVYSSKGIWYDSIYNKFKQAYPDKDPEKMFACIASLKDNNGNTIKKQGTENYYLMTSISGKASKQKQKKAKELLNFLLSDEGLKLMRYGVEGVHYKETDGKTECLLPKNDNGEFKKLNEVEPAANLLTLATWDSSFIPEWGQFREKRLALLDESMSNAVPDPFRGIVLDENKIDTTTQKELESMTVEKAAELTMNDADIDSEWDKFVQQWSSSGGSVLNEEVNKEVEKNGLTE